MMKTIALSVNGRPVRLQGSLKRPLLEALRAELGLGSLRDACGDKCVGLCYVLLRGKPTASCRLPLGRCAGASVMTLEGLREDPLMRKLEKAFLKHEASPCGYCGPAMLLVAWSLLSSKRKLGEKELFGAYRSVFCGCTAYRGVLSAVQDAHRSREITFMPVGEYPSLIGVPVCRTNAEQGVGRWIETVSSQSADGWLEAELVRSPFPSARIRGADLRPVEKVPGVIGVLLARDISGKNSIVPDGLEIPFLADRQVQWEGQPVALVVASGAESLQRACSVLEIRYEQCPAILDGREAQKPGASKVQPEGNVIERIRLREGNVEKALRGSDVRVEHRYEIPSITPPALGTFHAMARIDPEGRLLLWANSRTPFRDRALVAKMLGCPEDKIRLIPSPCGGMLFRGLSAWLLLPVALAAWKLRCPVRMRWDPWEAQKASPRPMSVSVEARTGALRNGKLFAADVRLTVDVGAYSLSGDLPFVRAALHALGPYSVPHFSIEVVGVRTNHSPGGADATEAVAAVHFAAEQQIDELSRTVGMDPVRFREVNGLKVGSRLPSGERVEESVGFLKTLKIAAKVAGFTARTRKSSEDSSGRGRSRVRRAGAGKDWQEGTGLACAFRNTGSGCAAIENSCAELELLPDGGLVLKVGIPEWGQGLSTMLKQIVAQELGADYRRVEIIAGDTLLTPDVRQAVESSEVLLAGNAVRAAAKTLRTRLVDSISKILGYPTHSILLKNHRVGLAHDRSVSLPFEEIFRRLGETLVVVNYRVPETSSFSGTDGASKAKRTHLSYGYITQVAKVEVNRRTGEVRIRELTSVQDVGKLINPLLARTRVEGEIREALERVFAHELRGNASASSRPQCALLHCDDLPELRCQFVEDPTTHGPYGAKGLGRLPVIPTAAAVSNAIYDAVGVRVTSLPIIPERLAALLRKKPAGRSPRQLVRAGRPG